VPHFDSSYMNIPAPAMVGFETLGVSRETIALLTRYVGHLTVWQARINLVSPKTLDEIWTRHVLDSAQLYRLGEAARTWIDLGSGAGLPGLVIACLLKGVPEAIVHLVESNRKKAAFLHFVSEDLGLPAHIHSDRIEDCLPGLPQPDVVTARALAPLGDLLGYSNLLLKRGATGLFPKGRDHDEELTAAGKDWHFSYRLHDSLTDAEARIVEVTMT
jgi:16S rRNA (guanine527-N7)-methyltransferase